jgi:cytidine deaminase
MKTYNSKFLNVNEFYINNDYSHSHYCFLLSGKNEYKTFKSNNTNCHAEVNLLNSISKFINNKKIDILVVRLNKSGRISNSKPCLHCLVHMKKYYNNNIRYVYFSNQSGYICRKSIQQLLNDDIHISKGNKKNL